MPSLRFALEPLQYIIRYIEYGTILLITTKSAVFDPLPFCAVDGPEPGPSSLGSDLPRTARGRDVNGKEIPGLPWAQQFVEEDFDEDYDSERTPSPEPRLKRKQAPVDVNIQGKLKNIAEKIGNMSPSKKKRESDDPFDISGLMKPVGGMHAASPGYVDRRFGGEYSTSPNVYKIQLPEINGKYVQEMRESMASLVELCQKLEEENAALKDLKIREDIEQVIEIQNEKVREHGQAASDVANHWKSEAERLAALLDKDHVDELNQKIRELQSRVSELELEANDLKVEKIEKDSRIVELQKRNTFLEKYARIYSTSDKCVGTDQSHGVDVGIQAPHGIANLKARSMAPEGIPTNSIYTYGAVDASGPHWGGMHRGHQEQTYDLQPQATIPHMASESKGISTGTVSWQKRQTGVPLTKESKAQGSRKVTMQPLVLGPDGQPNQIEFYSGSHGSGQQSVKHNSVHGHQRAEIPREEEGLLRQLGLDAEISGDAIVYSHPRTGFMFKICPAEDEDEDDDSGPAFDLEYVPLTWGNAKEAIGQCQTLEDQLLERMSFVSSSRNFLLKEIGEALRNA